MSSDTPPPLSDAMDVEPGCLGPVDWPAGTPLVLHCPEIRKRRTVGILVDRIELEWQ